MSPAQLDSILAAFSLLVGRPQHMSAAQYRRIGVELYARSPADFLIFGCGLDSDFWLALNVAGRTLFLEDAENWAAAVRRKGGQVQRVEYSCRLGVPMVQPAVPRGLDAAVLERAWELILVDGPKGYGDGPGREQSIWTAAELRRRHGATVFVHDYERRWERCCADRYLGKPDEVLTDIPRHLAVWRS